MSLSTLLRQFSAFVVVLCLAVTTPAIPAQADPLFLNGDSEATTHLAYYGEPSWSEYDLDEVRRCGSCMRCNLEGVDLHGANLHSGDFSESNLRNADLSDAISFTN